MISLPVPAARSQYLLDLLAQVPDPRKKRGRRHRLAGLLAVGISTVSAGPKSFAAIGQWAADVGPEVLAVHRNLNITRRHYNPRELHQTGEKPQVAQ